MKHNTTNMKRSQKKQIRPDEFILSALKPDERLEAALKIAGEAFKDKVLTEEDINEAVKTVRKKAYAKKK